MSNTVEYAISIKDLASAALQKLAAAAQRLETAMGPLDKQIAQAERALAASGAAASNMAKGISSITKSAQSGVGALRSFGAEVANVQRNMERMAFGSLNKVPSGKPGPLFSGSHNPLNYALNAYLGLAIGQTVAHGVGHVLDKANEQVMARYKMTLVGFDPKMMPGADAAVDQLTRKYSNLSKGQLYEQLYEGVSIYGNAEESLANIDNQARLASFLSVWDGGKHAGNSRSIISEAYAAVKSMEMDGVLNQLDPAKRKAEVSKYMDALVSMKVLYGDQARLGDYLKMQKAAGASFYGLNDNFKFGILPAMIQERGGPQVGTRLMTTFNTMNGATQLKQAQQAALAQYGLLEGAGKSAHVSAALREAFKHDPSQAAAMLMDRIASKQGLDPSKAADMARLKDLIPTELARMFPNRSTSGLFTDLLFNDKNFEKHLQAIGATRAELDKIAKGEFFKAATYGGALGSAAKQWDNLIAAIGKPMMQPAIDGLNALAQAFNSMTGGAEKNPGLVKYGAYAASAAGVAMLAGALVRLARFTYVPQIIGSGLVLLGRVTGLNTAASAIIVMASNMGRLVTASRLLTGLSLGGAFFIGYEVIQHWKELVGILERISGMKLDWLKNVGDKAEWQKYTDAEKAKTGEGSHAIGGHMPTMRQAVNAIPVDVQVTGPKDLNITVHVTGLSDAVRAAATVPFAATAATASRGPATPE